MKSVLVKAKTIVIPTKKLEREKIEIAKVAFGLVTKEATKYSEIVDVEFGGSYAKGTWIEGTHKADLDIFIRFKKSVTEKKFTDISKKIGFNALKKFKPYVKYSDHPYVEATIRKNKVNVVPCYNVAKGKWISAADRTHYHTEFMLESLSGQMKDDVRLLKQFLQINGIYGAEIAKQGFSGYVTEVLIWNFGSFENVIKDIAKIKPKQVIGNSSKKFDTEISIIDPIDANRNLSAAISEQNMGKFVLMCREFLKKPSISYFKEKRRKINRVNLKHVLTVKFQYKSRSPDIIWGQLKRAANAISVQLEMAGFNVIRHSASTDEKKNAGLIFLLDSLVISENHVKKGPEFFNDSDSSSFIAKNAKTSKLMWIGKDRKICSLQKRSYSNARKFLYDLLSKDLSKSGIPKGIQTDLKRFQITTQGKAVNKSIKEELMDMVSTDETIFSSS